MFILQDGRENFYQWDLDRKLIVNDNSINQVHFCNRTDNCSLVVDTYQENGITLVNVPNILLQSNWKIRVYGYNSNYTKYEKSFDVIARTKPADYIYTDEELKTWEELENKINEVEKQIDNIECSIPFVDFGYIERYDFSAMLPYAENILEICNPGVSVIAYTVEETDYYYAIIEIDDVNITAIVGGSTYRLSINNVGGERDWEKFIYNTYDIDYILLNYAQRHEVKDCVKKTDYATADNAGVVRIATGTHGLYMSPEGYLKTQPASTNEISAKSSQHRPIVPLHLEYAVKVCTNQKGVAVGASSTKKVLPPSTERVDADIKALSDRIAALEAKING